MLYVNPYKSENIKNQKPSWFKEDWPIYNKLESDIFVDDKLFPGAEEALTKKQRGSETGAKTKKGIKTGA